MGDDTDEKVGGVIVAVIILAAGGGLLGSSEVGGGGSGSHDLIEVKDGDAFTLSLASQGCSSAQATLDLSVCPGGTATFEFWDYELRGPRVTFSEDEVSRNHCTARGCRITRHFPVDDFSYRSRRLTVAREVSFLCNDDDYPANDVDDAPVVTSQFFWVLVHLKGCGEETHPTFSPALPHQQPPINSTNFEPPNDAHRFPETAHWIEPGQIRIAGALSTDFSAASVDFYRVTLCPGGVLFAAATFNSTMGDLGIALFDSDLTPLASNDSSLHTFALDGVQQRNVTHTNWQQTERDVFVSVYGENHYRLAYFLDTDVMGCQPQLQLQPQQLFSSSLLTNSSLPALQAGANISNTITITTNATASAASTAANAGGARLFRLPVQTAGPLRVTLTPDPDANDLDLYLLNEKGVVVAESARTGGAEDIYLDYLGRSKVNFFALVNDADEAGGGFSLSTGAQHFVDLAVSSNFTSLTFPTLQICPGGLLTLTISARYNADLEGALLVERHASSHVVSLRGGANRLFIASSPTDVNGTNITLSRSSTYGISPASGWPPVRDLTFHSDITGCGATPTFIGDNSMGNTSMVPRLRVAVTNSDFEHAMQLPARDGQIVLGSMRPSCNFADCGEFFKIAVNPSKTLRAFARAEHPDSSSNVTVPIHAVLYHADKTFAGMHVYRSGTSTERTSLFISLEITGGVADLSYAYELHVVLEDECAAHSDCPPSSFCSLSTGCLPCTACNLIDMPLGAPLHPCPPECSGRKSVDLRGRDLRSLRSLNWTDTSVQRVDISHNSLTRVRSTDKLPPTATHLALHDNNITSVTARTWPPGLRTVLLHNNDIRYIDMAEWPAGLRHLTLHNNSLTAITNVQWPGTLASLNLADNVVTSLSRVELPPNVTTLSLASNLITRIRHGPLTNLTQLTTLDLNSNGVGDTAHVALPPQLQHLDLSDNAILDVSVQTQWPPHLKSLDLDSNPWTALIDGSVSLREGDAVTTLTSALPCGLENLTVSHPAEPWTCTLERRLVTTIDVAAPDSENSVFTLCHATPVSPVSSGGSGSSSAELRLGVGDVANVWTCALTASGEALIQGTDAFRESVFEEADGDSSLVFLALLPSCFLVALVGWIIACAKKSHLRRNALVWLLLFMSLVDVGSDWAFYTLEVSSTNFEEAYDCTPVAPITVCNSPADEVYDCSSYGSLRDPCRGNVLALQNAASECECLGYQCVDLPGIAPMCTSSAATGSGGGGSGGGQQSWNSSARGGVTYTSFRDIEAASCTGFGGLDRSTDNVCGFLLEENPDASGTNECECHGFQCVELEGTGTQCKGLRPISYDTLLQLCLYSSIAGTVLFPVAWSLRLLRPPEPTDWVCGYRGDNSCWRLSSLVTGVLCVLGEDSIQLFVQIVYITTLDVVDNPVVLASMASTVGTMLFALLLVCCKSCRRHDDKLDTTVGCVDLSTASAGSCC